MTVSPTLTLSTATAYTHDTPAEGNTYCFYVFFPSSSLAPSLSRPLAPLDLPLNGLPPVSAPNYIVHSAKPGSPKAPGLSSPTSTTNETNTTDTSPGRGSGNGARRSKAYMGTLMQSPQKRSTTCWPFRGASSRLHQPLLGFFVRIMVPLTSPTTPTDTGAGTTANADGNTSLTTNSTTTTTKMWKNRRRGLVSCLCNLFSNVSRKPTKTTPEADYAQHLKSMQPTFYPKSSFQPSAAPCADDCSCLVLDLDKTLVHSSFMPFPRVYFEILPRLKATLIWFT